jgi:hypothetical protein
VSVYRGPGTQVLRAKCSNTAATEEGSRVRCLSPETQLSRLLIGLAWLLKLGFLGRYQYIKKRVLGFKFLGFLGDGFGVKGRVGVWVVVLSPSFVSHHQIWFEYIWES